MGGRTADEKRQMLIRLGRIPRSPFGDTGRLANPRELNRGSRAGKQQVLARSLRLASWKGTTMSEMFDRLAKMAAGGVSRRDALKSLGGFLAGGFLAVLPGRARADDDDDGDGDDVNEEAINKACKTYCSKCPKPTRGRRGDDDDDQGDEGGRGVHGRCIHRCKRFLRKHPTATACGACTATNPFTACLTGATCCTPTGAAAFCTNTGSDAKNCGACGNVCPTATPTCCSGTCVDTQTDANNCGSCGTKCASGKTCKAGVCA